MKRRLAADVESLGPPSVDNFDKQYVIECHGRRFAFDSRHGAGATGNNDNIRYMGFAVMMRPWRFLRLAMPIPGGPERKSVEYLAREAESWGPPMLYIDVDKREVTGHEGRHRCMVLEQACPATDLLVHIMPRGKYEMRARDVYQDVLDGVRAGLYNEAVYARGERRDKHRFVSGPLFDRAFVGKQEYTWGGGLGALFGRR